MIAFLSKCIILLQLKISEAEEKGLWETLADGLEDVVRFLLKCHSVEERYNNLPNCNNVFFKKWANSGLFFVLFLVFSIKQYNFLQQINEKKCHVRFQDSNPEPLEHKSSPIITRPRLQATYSNVCQVNSSENLIEDATVSCVIKSWSKTTLWLV